MPEASDCGFSSRSRSGRSAVLPLPRCQNVHRKPWDSRVLDIVPPILLPFLRGFIYTPFHSAFILIAQTTDQEYLLNKIIPFFAHFRNRNRTFYGFFLRSSVSSHEKMRSCEKPQIIMHKSVRFRRKPGAFVFVTSYCYFSFPTFPHKMSQKGEAHWSSNEFLSRRRGSTSPR
jgi:hypothetical protein